MPKLFKYLPTVAVGIIAMSIGLTPIAIVTVWGRLNTTLIKIEIAQEENKALLRALLYEKGYRDFYPPKTIDISDIKSDIVCQ